MEGKKSGRSKSKSQKEAASSPPMSEEEKSFVDNMKKRAIVKTHGIDNVLTCILNMVIDINL